MSQISTYTFPTEIHVGVGARNRIADGLKAAGVRTPLIVTDRDLAKLSPVAQVKDVIEGAGLSVSVFDGVFGNPVKSQVVAGVEAFRAAGADSIVAVGGGAALDVAKTIALMVHHPGDVFDYEDGKPDAPPTDKPMPYLVGVPTTAGTGSEVGRSTVISEDDTHVKRIIFTPRLLPSLVVEDPELTLELPAKITAATGMDALTHLVEAYVAKGHHPMADGIALEGVRLVANHLVDAVNFAKDPKGAPREAHLRARQAMMDAALMGAVAFQKGLGVTHSCAHALSTVCDTHHGLANGILIPHAMAFNMAACPERFAQLAVMVGLERATGDAFIEWIKDLQRDVGIPYHLSAAGVTHDHVEDLVGHAEKDGCHQNNPRPVSADDFRAIFTQAIG